MIHDALWEIRRIIKIGPQKLKQPGRFNVAQCNLGKVRLVPMQSAVLFEAVRDLWGTP